MAEQSDAVQRALAYPYAIPEASFTLAGGRALDLGAVEVDLSTRRPLLAYGSNAAPEVLARKLGADTEPLPVIRVVLAEVDAVYSAHISAYGSVPAALRRSRGTTLRAFAAYPTAEQLRVLSGTEPNYALRSASGPAARTEAGEEVGEALVYETRHGFLRGPRGAIAVAGIAAEGRRFAGMSQIEALELVRNEVCPDLTAEEMIEAACADPSRPPTWTRELRRRGMALTD